MKASVSILIFLAACAGAVEYTNAPPVVGSFLGIPENADVIKLNAVGLTVAETADVAKRLNVVSLEFSKSVSLHVSLADFERLKPDSRSWLRGQIDLIKQLATTNTTAAIQAMSETKDTLTGWGVVF